MESTFDIDFPDCLKSLEGFYQVCGKGSNIGIGLSLRQEGFSGGRPKSSSSAFSGEQQIYIIKYPVAYA